MATKRLEDLGLTVRSVGGAVEAELELTSGQLVNPLTRQFLPRAVFNLQGDRLVAIGPPELVGSPPVVLAQVERAGDIEGLLAESLNHHIFQLSRRSAELAALGISAQVEPQTLRLTAELTSGPFQFVLSSDRLGNFKVQHAEQEGRELTASMSPTFELSEFRERSALEGYLVALFSESAPPESEEVLEGEVVPQPETSLVTFGEVIRCFGEGAVLPPRSSLEILVELRVSGYPYRFAAARVIGRTFRGLLAGSAGRVWAERFELDEFPGVQALVSQLLSVPLEEVEVVGPGGA